MVSESRDKSQRLQRLHRQMNLPPPMPKVTLSTALRVMLKLALTSISALCANVAGWYPSAYLFIYNGELRDITTMRNRSPNVKSSKRVHYKNHIVHHLGKLFILLRQGHDPKQSKITTSSERINYFENSQKDTTPPINICTLLPVLKLTLHIQKPYWYLCGSALTFKPGV